MERLTGEIVLVCRCLTQHRKGNRYGPDVGSRKRGMGRLGWELAQQIREISPGFPVVYMTSAGAP
ncbi:MULTISPECIES: hypothetical protein [unclassified Bradyrhizobium]|uniref:hypothetical protein n=1 Tax=unclassified Bradyrhizobium TaxID=2631580 RepID=UPI001FF91474|nr:MULTISPECIES: hypothetical protein [unclassified Bradyrhizobium]